MVLFGTVWFCMLQYRHVPPIRKVLAMSESQLFDFKSSKEKLESLREKLTAISGAEVRQFNLSVPTAVSYAMTIYKSFVQDKALFVTAFKEEVFNPQEYDNFPTRVGALWHADIMLQQATDPNGTLAMLIDETKPLHQKMSKASAYLWFDDVDLAAVVASIREGSGYMDQADDLARYAALFTENWVAADGNCNVTLQDIEAARDFSARLIDAMTTTEVSSVAELRDLRNRAGEYMRQAVDDIKDAAQYVFRHDEEALKRYPSLFTGHWANRKKRTSPQTEATQEQSNPTATIPSPLPSPQASIQSVQNE